MLGGGVDGDEVVAALVREHARLGVEQPEAVAEPSAKLEQAPVERQQRRRIAALRFDVAALRVECLQPRSPGREAAGRARVPGHRVTQPVAPGPVERRIGAGAVRLADLVSLVDEGRPGEREQQDGRGTEVLRPHAGGEPVEVVVRHHPDDAAELRRRLDRCAQPLGVPGREEELEREDEIEHLQVARELRGRLEDLADQERHRPLPP